MKYIMASVCCSEVMVSPMEAENDLELFRDLCQDGCVSFEDLCKYDENLTENDFNEVTDKCVEAYKKFLLKDKSATIIKIFNTDTWEVTFKRKTEEVKFI